MEESGKERKRQHQNNNPQKQKARKSCGCEGDLRSGARRRGRSSPSPSGEQSSRSSRGLLKGPPSWPREQRESTIREARGSLDHQSFSITRCSMLRLLSLSSLCPFFHFSLRKPLSPSLISSSTFISVLGKSGKQT